MKISNNTRVSCKTGMPSFHLGNYHFNSSTPGNNSEFMTALGLSTVEIYVQTCLLLLISVTGVINNTLILMAAAISGKLRKQAHLLVVNLAFMDLLVTAVYCPLYAFTIIKGKWSLHHNVCVLSALLLSQNTGVSVIFNFAIACNRYFTIVRHPLSKRLCSTRTILIAIGLIWSVITVSHIILVFWGPMEIRYNQMYNICIPIYKQQSNYLLFSTLYYTYIIGIFGPFLGSFLCYFKVYQTVQGQMEVIKSRRARKRYIETTKRMGIILVTFAVCWLPDTLHYLIDRKLDSVPEYITRALLTLFLLNSAANPFVFAWKFPSFRQTISSCFSCKRQISRRHLHDKNGYLKGNSIALEPLSLPTNV